MQTTDNPAPACADSYQARVKAQKELVESLKVQWRLLWTERFNDKVRAEDVSLKNYVDLSVESGTVIHANRDCKSVTFKEILEQHEILNPDRYVQPNAQDGGWNRFVKTKITGRQSRRKEFALPQASKRKEPSQPKKGGRGWLHAT